EDAAVVRTGGSARRDRIELSAIDTADAVLFDYDNDGWLDLLVVGRRADAPDVGVIRLYRGGASGTWSDVSEATGLAALSFPAIRSVLAADADVDGDTDLLLVTVSDGLRWLRNDGGHANGQLKVRLATLKTNPTGLGAHLELRAGPWWVTRGVHGLPIEIGLGGRRKLDSLQTVWTDGVVDNQIDVTPGSRPVTVVEKKVAVGSCPFLYAWDGQRFRFVTDILGNAPIGLSLRRDVFLDADSDEIVWIGDSDAFRPRTVSPPRHAERSEASGLGSGEIPRSARNDDVHQFLTRQERGGGQASGHHVYSVVVTDEYREVVYLDHARLVAVDHAADVEVHATDKLMPAPFPESQVWALSKRRGLLRALGDDGLDRTDALAELDGVFAPPGVPLGRPLRGMCHPLTLTLEFAPPDGAQDPGRARLPSVWHRFPTGETHSLQTSPILYETGSKPLVLALTGWLQYGDASTNIALSQGDERVIIGPRLEVETDGGAWEPVDVVVGMPAGKTKTILVDLTGSLPAGARRLRLTTTFEIRWDRIALFERAPLGGGQIHELSPLTATLGFRGFSDIESRAAGHPTTPAFNAVAATPPWRGTLEGWCTRYGDVLDLVAARDDRLAVFNSGDALTLDFDAALLPPVPPGMTRTFFFHSAGWEKDGDHNVVHGDTVEPLPASGDVNV
ncbi:MAG: FG-GAP repeat domain-containing protein, partial [Phycisphaerae bacterium]